MNDHALRQLLCDADAAAGSPPSTSADPRGHQLASRVQKRLRRRTQLHLTGASLLLCAILALVPLMRTSPKPLPVADSSQAKTELALIRLQADSQAATVNRLIQYQKSVDLRAAAARKFDRGQPLDRLQQQRENAARLLTQEREFRRAIELFPETHWASIAKQRLQS
jgi:hypothetical protein